MKKIAIILIATLGLYSCSEDFITKDPLGVSSSASYYNDPDQCQLALNAVYDPLGWQEVHDELIWKIGDICTDDCERGGDGVKSTYLTADDWNKGGQLAVFAATDRSGAMQSLWQSLYIAIGRANALLNGTESLTSGDNAEKYKVMRAEARFLRAWYYFQLTKIFGPVILVKQSVSVADAENLGNRASGDDNVGSKQVRAQYDFIIDELEAIKDDLPKTASAVGKVTNGAARAFLAKAYLYRADFCSNSSDYENAYQTAYQLYTEANGSTYALEEHYQDVFDIYGETHENSKEVVFSIQFMSGTMYNRQGNGSIRCLYVSPRYFWDPAEKATMQNSEIGYGFAIPTQNLLDEFEAGDARATMIVASPHGDATIDATITKLNLDTAVWCKITSLSSDDKWYAIGKHECNTGYYNMKQAEVNSLLCNGGFNSQVAGKDYILLRWADVMLIAAEAGVQSGHATEAKDLINKLRERARNSARTIDYKVAGSSAACYTYTPAATPADIASADLDAVKHERRVEMYGEGERYWDIVRWGLATNTYTFREKDLAGNTFKFNTATLGRWPIPQSEIILHTGGNLKQNPGY